MFCPSESLVSALSNWDGVAAHLLVIGAFAPCNRSFHLGMRVSSGAHHKTDTPWHLTICNGAGILVSHKKWAASSWMGMFCPVGYAWNEDDHGCRDRYDIALTWSRWRKWWRDDDDEEEEEEEEEDNDADATAADEDENDDQRQSRGHEDIVASAWRLQQREEKHMKCLDRGHLIWHNQHDILRLLPTFRFLYAV